MKRIITWAAVAVFVATFATQSFAQVTTQATATARIVATIAIQKSVDMDFGNIAVTANGGTVVLSTAGARTKTGGVTLPATTGTVTAASFDISGEPAYTYTITLPTGTPAHTITRGGGTETMTLTSFVSNPSGTGTLDGTGKQTLLVGATLNVSANQVPGTYTNAAGFDVTVNYN